MKRCSTSYDIRELPIKTIMRHHDTIFRMAELQNADNTKHWWGCEASGTLIHWWECKVVVTLGKQFGNLLLNIVLPYEPTITLLGTYPNELKTYKILHIDIYRSFIYNCQKIGGNEDVSLISGWRNKLRYIQSMESYLAIKRKELSHQKVMEEP